MPEKDKNLNNSQLARLMRDVSAVYQILGENQFKIRAYENAADSIENSSREVRELWEEGKLQNLPGIGANISSHLEELFKKGKVKHFTQVFSKVPSSVFEFLKIPGVGSKIAYKLATQLNITTSKNAIKLLQKAASSGKIRKLDGFGEDSEARLLKSIQELKKHGDRILLQTATRVANDIIEYLSKDNQIVEINTLGSLRRKVPTVGDIDIAVSSNNPKSVINRFTKYPKTHKLLVAGKNTARLITKSGVQIDIKVQRPESFGSLLQHFTGSKAHNIRLRELAIKKGLSLSEHGIKKHNKTRKYSSEAEFYQTLGLVWIPPELREDAGEIEAARESKLPNLVRAQDIKGDLHTHTNYSWRSSHDQGENSIREMIDKALKLGHQYVGIGDHNPTVSSYKVSKIISIVKERSKIIEDYNYPSENFNENRDIKVLNTLEVDILANGNLALPDHALKHLDYAVVSIHSSMRMSRRTMTRRVIKGLSHPKAKILGHPTGRLLNKREGYELEWEQLLKFMKAQNKFLEINSWPTRLDLPDSLVREAKNFGVKFAINSDAHATKHLHLLKYGVSVARRGWCEKQDIINTLSFNKLKKHLLR